jgi:selenocysteine lyase/cysteine desulfurase
MLPSQRALFDIPPEICYLNAASYSPLPLAVQEAGHAGVARKGQPWKVPAAFAGQQYERTREAAARLINADAADVALISSVSYGVASAAKVLKVPKGSRVILLKDDHTSPVLEWTLRAPAEGFTVETVEPDDDGDWTAALLQAIERKGAPPVGLASISSLHWSSGGAIDIDRVAAALKRHGAALLIDATQGAGIMDLDVRRIDPDFLVFPTYKWVLGPYGRAFLYVAKRHQDGMPLEQTGFGRRAISSESTPYMRDTAFVANARRFDMGERDWFITLEMASIGMELVASWGREAIAARLRMLTSRIAEGLRNTGILILDERLRVPHILSLTFPQGMPAGLIERLAEENVHVASRLGRLRISPHVYNDEADADRFVTVFRRVVA